jgi:hypothetical protein
MAEWTLESDQGCPHEVGVVVRAAVTLTCGLKDGDVDTLADVVVEPQQEVGL